MSEKIEQCDNCKYFHSGKCRRYPPQVFLVGETGNTKPMQYFPEVNHDEYCGEFKYKSLVEE